MKEMARYHVLSRRLASNKAFTMIEVLVAAGILTLLVATGFAIFTNSSSQQQKTTTSLQMQGTALSSQNRIVRAIRDGIDFILPALGEEAAALFFADGENNIRVIYQQKDEELSKKTEKDLYKLLYCRVKSRGLLAEDSVVLAESVKDVKFKVLTANTVNVTACFATEHAEFQTMFEVGLQNSGVME